MSDQMKDQPAFAMGFGCETHMDHIQEGLTKREYFAGQALAIIPGRVWEDSEGNIPDDVFDRWANACVQAADALIARLEQSDG